MTDPATTAFDYQPTLAGELVTVRPLRVDDHDALHAVARDPLIWEQHPDQTRHTPEGFARFFQQSLDSGGALVAVRSGTGEVIGSSRYHGFDPPTSEVEIGWTFLARAYWGGRYNGELKRLMLAHAFRYVERVVFLVGPDNLRSQHAVLKLGAVRAGSRVDASGTESVVFELRPEAAQSG
jgi:RimJ/RimL family protein N-acetyltransferase